MITQPHRTYSVILGVLLGPLALAGLRFAAIYIWQVASNTTGWTYSTGYFYFLVWRSLPFGALLGGSSVMMWNGWSAREKMRLRHATWVAIATLLIVTAGKVPQFALLWRTSVGPQFIPWEIGVAFLLLATDITLLWAILLVITGKLAANRIAYEQQRAHQFDVPVETAF